jgi:hypothetical protein
MQANHSAAPSNLIAPAAHAQNPLAPPARSIPGAHPSIQLHAANAFFFGLYFFDLFASAFACCDNFVSLFPRAKRRACILSTSLQSKSSRRAPRSFAHNRTGLASPFASLSSHEKKFSSGWLTFQLALAQYDSHRSPSVGQWSIP